MKTVSIESLIGKILRDTKVSDMSYINDMQEWIPEALDKINIQRLKTYQWCTLNINEYGFVDISRLNIEWIGAVVYDGMRILPWKQMKAITYNKETVVNAEFTSIIVREVVELADATTHNFWKSIVVKNNSISTNSDLGYKIENNRFYFSKPSVAVDIHFQGIATDAKGFPLIYDDGHLLDAIYWYVRHKMICSGYLDPVYGRDDRICYERWETEAGRATRIDYPTLDEAEASMRQTQRMVFPTDYFANFNQSLPQSFDTL